MAITLVTVLPEGGIYYGQVYLVCSSEDKSYGSHGPSPPYLERGATDDGDEPVLGPNELNSMLGEKPSLSSVLRLQKLQLDDDCINAHVSLLGCPSAIIWEYWMSP
jgi:hypothetical protein